MAQMDTTATTDKEELMTEEMCNDLADKKWSAWDAECVDAWVYYRVS